MSAPMRRVPLTLTDFPQLKCLAIDEKSPVLMQAADLLVWNAKYLVVRKGELAIGVIPQNLFHDKIYSDDFQKRLSTYGPQMTFGDFVRVYSLDQFYVVDEQIETYDSLDWLKELPAQDVVILSGGALRGVVTRESLEAWQANTL